MACTTAAISIQMKKHKQYTLVLPLDLQNDRVLLGYKLRGFGQGKYNGFGGKIELGETIVAAAIRELHEESNLVCEEVDMIQRGALLLETVADDSSPILEIHVFTAEKWKGTEMATDEMRPAWFSISKSLNPTTHGLKVLPGIPSGSPSASFLSTSTAVGTIDGNSAHDLQQQQQQQQPPNSAYPPIPYHEMWEESRVWLPHLLQLASSATPAPNRARPAENTETGGVNSTNPSSSARSSKYFIHHVEFVGGYEEEGEEGNGEEVKGDGQGDNAAAGGYSAWHKMGERHLDWVDELPFEEWETKRTFGKYP